MVSVISQDDKIFKLLHICWYRQSRSLWVWHFSDPRTLNVHVVATVRSTVTVPAVAWLSKTTHHTDPTLVFRGPACRCTHTPCTLACSYCRSDTRHSSLLRTRAGQEPDIMECQWAYDWKAIISDTSKSWLLAKAGQKSGINDIDNSLRSMISDAGGRWNRPTSWNSLIRN